MATATLGLAVESTGVSTATVALESLVAAANALTAAANKMTAAMGPSGVAGAATAQATALAQSTAAIVANTNAANSNAASQSAMIQKMGMSNTGQGQQHWSNMISGMSGVGQAANKAQTSVAGIGKAAQLSARDVGMFGQQMNDVVVSLQGGMSIMSVAMQQGTEITQMFTMQGIGLRAALPLIGKAIISFITNPFTLALAAIAGIGWALTKAYSWFTSSGGGERINKLLKEQNETVKTLTEGYKNLGGAAMIAQQRMEQAVAEAQQRTTIGKLEEEVKPGFLTGMQGGIPLSPAISSMLNVSAVNIMQIPPFMTAYTQLAEKLRSGQIDLIEFRTQLASLNFEFKDPAIAGFIAYVDGLARSMTDAEAAIDKAKGSLEEFRAIENQSMSALDIFEKSREGRKPTQSAIVEAQTRLAIQALTVRSAEERAAPAGNRERQRLIEAGEDLTTSLSQRKMLAAIEREYAEAIHQSNEATKSRLIDMHASVLEEQLNLSLIGKTAEETARLRSEYELLSKAAKAAIAEGRAISEAELAAIQATSEARGAMAKQTAQINMAQDIWFKSQLVGLNETERAVKELTHSAGLMGDVLAESFAKYSVELDKAIERSDELRGSFKGFLSDILHGKIPAEALLEKVMDIGEQAMTDLLLGEKGTAGTGLLGKFLGPILGVPEVPKGLEEMANVRLMNITAQQVFLTMGGGALPTATPGATTPAAKVYDPLTGKMIDAPSYTTGGGGTPGSGSFKIVGSYMPGVDPSLIEVLRVGAVAGGFNVSAFSGKDPRSSGTKWHPGGIATDVFLIDASGKAVGGDTFPYQDPELFRQYEKYAQSVYTNLLKTDPAQAAKLRWGGYFSDDPGKPGALDLMHLDYGGGPGGAGMAGGSWAGGLTAAQRGLWPGATSVGLGAELTKVSQNFTKDLGENLTVVTENIPPVGQAFTADLASGLGGVVQGIGGIIGGPAGMAVSGIGQLASLFMPASVVSPAMAAGGGHIPTGHWAIAGEAGPEVVTGPSTVVPFGQGMNDNSRAPNVIIHQSPGASVAETKKTGPNGRDIRIMMRDTMRQGIANGEFDEPFGMRYGARVKKQPRW